MACCRSVSLLYGWRGGAAAASGGRRALYLRGLQLVPPGGGLRRTIEYAIRRRRAGVSRELLGWPRLARSVCARPIGRAAEHLRQEPGPCVGLHARARNRWMLRLGRRRSPRRGECPGRAAVWG